MYKTTLAFVKVFLFIIFLWRGKTCFCLTACNFLLFYFVKIVFDCMQIFMKQILCNEVIDLYLSQDTLYSLIESRCLFEALTVVISERQ